MLDWVMEYLPTIVIGALLLLAVVFAIRSLVKSRKAGG